MNACPRRHVGDPLVLERRARDACLYGAAMMRKIGRLPLDLHSVDVLFEPPGTLVFMSVEVCGFELGRFVIPERVLNYDPKPQLMPPEAE